MIPLLCIVKFKIQIIPLLCIPGAPAMSRPPSSSPGSSSSAASSSQSQLPVVGSLQDAFAWPAHALQKLRELHGAAAVERARCALLRDGATMSTAFSGVDTPGVAADMLASELAGGRCADGNAPRGMASLHATELLEESRIELQLLPNPPGCIFTNIMSFLSPRVQGTLQGPGGALLMHEDLRQLFLKRGVITLRAYCAVHQKQCVAARSHVHVAGTPCVDWSSQGARKKAQGSQRQQGNADPTSTS